MRRFAVAWLGLAFGLTVTFHAAAQGQPQAPRPAPRGNFCSPPCRDGFFCHQGSCISACNPGCGPGERCTSFGECIPDPDTQQSSPPTSTPLAAPPEASSGTPPKATTPSTTASPPPAGMPVPGQSTARADTAWQPEFSNRSRAERHVFRPYALVQIGLGGELKWNNFTNTASQDPKFDLKPGGGFEAGLEVRLSRLFGVAPGFRFQQAPLDIDGVLSRAIYSEIQANIFELLITPTFHFPFDSWEILLPISFGLAYGEATIELSSTATTAGVDSNLTTSGYGASVGFTPGVAVWLSDSFSFIAQLGFIVHAIGLDEEHDNEVAIARPVLNLGGALGF